MRARLASALVLVGLALAATPEVEPPAEVWDRIEAALESSQQPAEDLRVIRFHRTAWQPWSGGLDMKVLTRDAAGAPNGFLMRMEPGAFIPEHVHDCIEECLVIEGDLLHEGKLLTAGDFMVGRTGSVHAPMTSPGGGLLYVRYLSP